MILPIGHEQSSVRRLPWAVVAAHGLAARPVVLVDLVLNWNDSGAAPLHVLRLRSDRFDPRKLVPGAADALAALRQLLADLLTRSAAVPLPDADAARGRPFRVFSDPLAYQREVLQVDC